MFYRVKKQSNQTWDEVLSEQALLETVAKLLEEGQISNSKANEIRETITEHLDKANYILRHLAAHLSIGVVFAFDPLPLPLGTFARVGWVISARITETVRHRRDQARVHSLRITAISAIPLFGYSAYFFALKEHSPAVAVLAVNSYSLWKTGKTASHAAERLPKPVRRIFLPLWSW